MSALRTHERSVTRAYLDLRERCVREVLGCWVSGLEPWMYQRVDVTPTVLFEIGISAPGATSPQFKGQVTVGALSAAMGWSL